MKLKLSTPQNLALLYSQHSKNLSKVIYMLPMTRCLGDAERVANSQGAGRYGQVPIWHGLHTHRKGDPLVDFAV